MAHPCDSAGRWVGRTFTNPPLRTINHPPPAHTPPTTRHSPSTAHRPHTRHSPHAPTHAHAHTGALTIASLYYQLFWEPAMLEKPPHLMVRHVGTVHALDLLPERSCPRDAAQACRCPNFATLTPPSSAPPSVHHTRHLLGAVRRRGRCVRDYPSYGARATSGGSRGPGRAHGCGRGG